MGESIQIDRPQNAANLSLWHSRPWVRPAAYLVAFCVMAVPVIRHIRLSQSAGKLPPEPAPQVGSSFALWPDEIHLWDRRWKCDGPRSKDETGDTFKQSYSAGDRVIHWTIARWPVSREVVNEGPAVLYEGPWPRK